MRLFRPSLQVTFDPKDGLLLQHRPSLAMLGGAVALVALVLLFLCSLRWEVMQLSLWLAFPAWWTGCLAWFDWQTLHLPKHGHAVKWQDGLRRGEIPGERILAASVEYSVQPRLHKGPGPTGYLKIWLAVRQTPARPKPEWQRVFTFIPEAIPERDLKESGLYREVASAVKKALKDLGYPEEVPETEAH